MSREQFEEMGPVEYVVIEWPKEQHVGDAAPLILDLHDRGIIRILDVALLAKDTDGSVATLEIGALDGDGEGGLNPGTSAAVLVWENRWAAPIAVALRRSGGQLVASGRIPIQAILAELDAVESTN